MKIYDKLLNKINELRKINKNIITNAFFTTDDLRTMIEKENVSIKILEDIIIILIEEECLIRLYFYANSLESFNHIQNIIPKYLDKPIIADIIGKDIGLEQITNKLKELNFYNYGKFIRMNRLLEKCDESNISNVEVATLEQVDEIKDILYKELDVYSSHLPSKDELYRAVENKEITIIMEQKKIIGLVYFKELGKKLIYWHILFVHEEFRGKGISDNLIKNKFGKLQSDMTCQLWVDTDNKYAINKHSNYGFKADGLVDYIMMYRGE
ncbi:GNAT family N-acetyltransferase [Tissierella sp.]|uniref:GNAT family N-acetyltransferase n=1 Tax=Tissierella sp. TaxID=41274 RepID=UPI00306ED482